MGLNELKQNALSGAGKTVKFGIVKSIFRDIAYWTMVYFLFFFGIFSVIFGIKPAFYKIFNEEFINGYIVTMSLYLTMSFLTFDRFVRITKGSNQFLKNVINGVHSYSELLIKKNLMIKLDDKITEEYDRDCFNYVYRGVLKRAMKQRTLLIFKANTTKWHRLLTNLNIYNEDKKSEELPPNFDFRDCGFKIKVKKVSVNKITTTSNMNKETYYSKVTTNQTIAKISSIGFEQAMITVIGIATLTGELFEQDQDFLFLASIVCFRGFSLLNGYIKGKTQGMDYAENEIASSYQQRVNTMKEVLVSNNIDIPQIEQNTL